jgi:DmsE family decaheme c-type cytochrome
MIASRKISCFILLLFTVLSNNNNAADSACVMCHQSASNNSHAPFGSSETNSDRQPACTSCHGDSATHLSNPMNESPDITFKPTGDSGVGSQSAQCTGCHRKTARYWDNSVHVLEDLTCNNCHNIHGQRKALPSADQQIETCTACHQRVRTETLLPSHHPIEQAEMVCTSCHNPHGSITPGELTGISLNDTCLNCHESQRGPFLFDHPPASEDCMNCHRPHGSVHEPLLNARGPHLCQQCHVANFHPSDLNAGGGLPGRTPSASLLGRNCMSCHPAVHGSNHPSGARLTR